jgi:hypothetical protein
MTPLNRLACLLVRGWTACYTRGLPDAERRSRLSEVESDLWESLHEPTTLRPAALHILLRLAGGVVDDVAWRLDAGPIPARHVLAAVSVAGTLAIVGVLWMTAIGTPGPLPAIRRPTPEVSLGPYPAPPPPPAPPLVKR